MADDTSAQDQDEADDGDENPRAEVISRDTDLSKRAGMRTQLADLFADVLQGFQNQIDRADEAMDYWDIYNCKLTGKQAYNGNSQIFVPIVHNAVNARKTRFVNQMFPRAGRYVEAISEDGKQPYAQMALLEYYIRKAKLRTKIMPALTVNGDIEGQYNLLIEWCTQKRNVTYKTWEPAVMLEEGVPNPAAEEVETITEEEIETAWPEVEVLKDSDVLVLPETSQSVEEAIAAGGSVTVIRRWTKSKIRQMARDGHIREDAADSLCETMADQDAIERGKKQPLEAAGIKTGDGSPYALVYQTWSVLKVKGKRVLCLAFYGGEQNVLGCKRNPLWSDRVPVISVPVDKVSGALKGISKISAVADMQYFANDAINEAADSAAYSLLPIVMTDPEKNPRVGSMVMSLAAVWETSPKDTQFAQFPELWKDGFAMVAAAKAEVAQTLSVSPAAITGGGSASSKPTQADVAREQQVDILTTADAVTVIEEGVLTPMLEIFVEMDHQYRDKEIMVKQFGQMGQEATMQSVPPIQFGARYEYRWFGVEQARSAQMIQQQIAGMNVLRGIPPEQLGGYKVNLVPLITNFVENTFGPRIAPLIFQSPEQQMPVPVNEENMLLINGFEVPVHELDDDQQHIQAHGALLQNGGDAQAPKNSKKIMAHIYAHVQQMQKKVQMQMAAAQGQGAPGVPGGAMGGEPQPGVAGTPRIGAQPGQPRTQGPPGMIHQDRMQDPSVPPRL